QTLLFRSPLISGAAQGSPASAGGRTCRTASANTASAVPSAQVAGSEASSAVSTIGSPPSSTTATSSEKRTVSETLSVNDLPPVAAVPVPRSTSSQRSWPV